MKEESVTLQVGAVIYATGWRPYDAAKIQPYGYDRFVQTVRGTGYRFSTQVESKTEET